MKPTLRDQLIASGVRSLNDLGYSECTVGNILADEFYKELFRRKLEDAIGASHEPYLSTVRELHAEVSK